MGTRARYQAAPVIDNGRRDAADFAVTGRGAVQNSGVGAQVRVTDLAALIACDIARPAVTPAFRYADPRRGTCAAAQMCHGKLADDSEPHLAFVRRGGKFDRDGETSDIDAATNAVRQASLPLLQDVRDMDWRTLESTIGQDEGHVLSFGPAP